MKYITFYNIVSLTLWTIVLLDTFKDVLVYTNSTTSYQSIYSIPKLPKTFPHEFMAKVQFFNSAFELAHSIAGIVNTPFTAIALQSSARLLITLGICYQVPQSPANFHFLSFTTMAVSWSLSEIIRCTFYSFKSSSKVIPYWIVWLRYSAFVLLYPLGLVCESYIVYSTLDSVKGTSYYYFLVFALATYPPGFAYLYRHMLVSRRAVLGRARPTVVI